MAWSLSRFRAGDLVEVRSKEEILATLDECGCVDGMPFMPEMLQYCGKQYRVAAVAHKTCETAHKTYVGRRISEAVHLAGMRCDGSAHGGCEAECTIFWKDAWLKRADETQSMPIGRYRPTVCTEEQLYAATCPSGALAGAEKCYSCQSTMLYDATTPLAWWDPRQYVYDVTTRNYSIFRVFRVLWLATVMNTLLFTLRRLPFGYKIVKGIGGWIYRITGGRPVPTVNGKIKKGTRTPTGRLNLQPGEYVRIKTQAEIEETLNEEGHNRGLSFDGQEMAPYCGKTFKVHRTVTKILDELTGKMLTMKEPCVYLEEVVCTSQYSSCRLNCPRAYPCYWREIWLERVEGPAEMHLHKQDACGAGGCEHHAAPPANQRISLPTLSVAESLEGAKSGAAT